MQRLAIGQVAAQRELDATVAFLNRHFYARAFAQTEDIVDVQLPFGYQFGYTGYMPCVQFARQQRYHITVLLLPANPRRVLLFAQRREAYNHLQARAAEQHLFDHIAALARVIDADQNTQVQLMMQVRLTNVLDIRSVPTQYLGYCRSHTGLVKTDDVNQYKLAIHINALLTCSRDQAVDPTAPCSASRAQAQDHIPLCLSPAPLWQSLSRLCNLSQDSVLSRYRWSS